MKGETNRSEGASDSD